MWVRVDQARTSSVNSSWRQGFANRGSDFCMGSDRYMDLALKARLDGLRCPHALMDIYRARCMRWLERKGPGRRN